MARTQDTQDVWLWSPSNVLQVRDGRILGGDYKVVDSATLTQTAPVPLPNMIRAVRVALVSISS